MAIASRSIHSSGISFKSIVFTGLALALVVGLFFIPEIIQFQRSISGVSKVAGELKTLQTATARNPSDPKESQLSRIAALIDSGYLERISAGKEQPSKAIEKTSTTSKEEQKNAITKGSETKVRESANDGISWKAIKSKNSRTAIKKAQSQISEILADVPAYNSASRFALASLVNGLERILDTNTEKTLSARDAQLQIEKLYAESANDFVREGVSQLLYERFTGIDFGPALRSNSPILSGETIRFNPHLTINNVSIQERGPTQNKSIMVSFEGFVIGDDVIRIEMISDGIRFDDIVPKKTDSSGYRRFKVKRFELTGKVLLKIYDRNGRVFQKLYSFYPRAKIFEGKSGKYSIPKASSEFDTRLDRFFTLQVSRPLEDGDFILESNGFEKF